MPEPTVYEMRDSDSGRLLGYWCRGDVEPAAFLTAVQCEMDLEHLPEGHVLQCHARCRWSFVDQRSELDLHVAPGRGAYRVTYVDVTDA